MSESGFFNVFLRLSPYVWACTSAFFPSVCICLNLPLLLNLSLTFSFTLCFCLHDYSSVCLSVSPSLSVFGTLLVFTCRHQLLPLYSAYSSSWDIAGPVIKRLWVRVPQERPGTFSSPELTSCADLLQCLFHPSVSAVAFYQQCRWQVTPKHSYTLDPTKSEWTDNAAVQAEWGNLSGKELTGNSSGSTQP